jgi:hypothetical protein
MYNERVLCVDSPPRSLLEARVRVGEDKMQGNLSTHISYNKIRIDITVTASSEAIFSSFDGAMTWLKCGRIIHSVWGILIRAIRTVFRLRWSRIAKNAAKELEESIKHRYQRNHDHIGNASGVSTSGRILVRPPVSIYLMEAPQWNNPDGWSDGVAARRVDVY